MSTRAVRSAARNRFSRHCCCVSAICRLRCGLRRPLFTERLPACCCTTIRMSRAPCSRRFGSQRLGAAFVRSSQRRGATRTRASSRRRMRRSGRDSDIFARAGRPPALPGRPLRCNSAGRCSFEETALQDSGDREPGPRRSAADARRVLLAFHPPDEGLVRGDVRREPLRRAARHRDSAHHRPPRGVDGGRGPRGRGRRGVADAHGDGGARAARAAGRDPDGHRDPPERARAGRDEPDPLAEPLARRAAEPDVLPERLRGPNRESRDADRRVACARARCRASAPSGTSACMA